MNDQLLLKNMTFYAFHGDDSKERELGQRYEVDVEMRVDAKLTAANDNLNDAVNYKNVFGVVEEFMTKKRYRLIETLAVSLAEEIAAQFQIPEVCVAVRKLKPPIQGILDYVEISYIHREK